MKLPYDFMGKYQKVKAMCTLFNDFCFFIIIYHIFSQTYKYHKKLILQKEPIKACYDRLFMKTIIFY